MISDIDKEKFRKLWNESSEFHGLFTGQGRIFVDWDTFDEDLAQILWANRRPRLDWDICGVDGCRTMVKKGEKCPKHVDFKGKMPIWRWVNGSLYKFIRIPKRPDRADRTKEYIRYELFVALQRFGTVPKGWSIGRINGNPFDMDFSNIIITTKISQVALAFGYIRMNQAAELDKTIAEFVAKNTNGGDKPFIGTYGYTDIARVARCTVATVREAARKKLFDVNSLFSIMDFANRKKYIRGCKVKLDANGQ